MRIAVGSRREPKIAGVTMALERLADLPWPGEEVALAPVDVASGQADTPLSREATLAGARARARAALAAVLAGEDLAHVIDRHANEHDVRSRQGAFGVLTAGVLTRADAYVQAVLTALAPWYKGQWEG